MTLPCPLGTLHRCCIFTPANMESDAFRIFSGLHFCTEENTLWHQDKNVINCTIVFCSFWALGKWALSPRFCKFCFGILICSSWTFTDECMLKEFCLYNMLIVVKRGTNLCMYRNKSVSKEKLLQYAFGTCSVA